jgi:D-alanyl-D-alanine carboxypeptidase
MKEILHKYTMNPKLWPIIRGIILALLVILFVATIYQFIILRNLGREFTATKQNLADRVATLEAGLATSTLTSQELAQKLLEEQQKSSEFEESISDIAGTVGTLEKLSKTDRELLQKYSKVYFLSDNYVPMRLKDIDTDYLNDSKTDLQFHALALPYLEKMIRAAEDDGVSLKVVSAYRSFGTQSALKNGYLVTYGSGANQFSADQGYSEHQLGTTVDLTTPGQTPALAISLETTPAYEWLTKNAYRYGFVLSYPKGNAYYQYEPWHWRFVGRSLATRLHNDDQYFSDMDQRDIDKYLVKIFD